MHHHNQDHWRTFIASTHMLRLYIR